MSEAQREEEGGGRGGFDDEFGKVDRPHRESRLMTAADQCRGRDRSPASAADRVRHRADEAGRYRHRVGGERLGSALRPDHAVENEQAETAEIGRNPGPYRRLIEMDQHRCTERRAGHPGNDQPPE